MSHSRAKQDRNRLFGFHLGTSIYVSTMRHLFIMLCTLGGLWAGLSSAQPAPEPDRIGADTPDGALVCAAGRFRGDPLSIEYDDGMFELRWLTPSQNVLRITLTGPGCRFVEVRGIGLSEARILP